MIPPMPDRASPVASDSRRVSAATGVDAAMPAFATLLASAPVRADVVQDRLLGPAMPAPTSVEPTPPDMRATGPSLQQARVFNHDGFFGAMSVPLGSADVAVDPGVTRVAMPEPPPVPETSAAGLPGTSDPVATAPTGGRSAMRGPDAGVMAQAVPSIARAPAQSPPGAIRFDPPPRPSKPAAASAMRTAASSPRPPVLPAAPSSSAVAVHAVRHGLDVVARIAALDAAGRLRLADEIAALLSRHGYAPGRIAVVAGGREDGNC